MPKVIRTAYAAYCTASAKVFDDFVDDFDAEACFARQLFGEERFQAESGKKKPRIWEYKDCVVGCSNRPKIFQGEWISSYRRKEIELTERLANQIKGELGIVKKATNWTKVQTKTVQDYVYGKQTGEVDYALNYRMAITGMLKSIQGVIAEIDAERDGQTDSLAAEPSENLQFLDYCLNGMLQSLQGFDSRDASVREMRSFLKELGSGPLTDLAEWLRVTKRNLSVCQKEVNERAAEASNAEACRNEALINCVEAMVCDEAPLWRALNHLKPREFSQEFAINVLPEIEQGFLIESYSAENIDMFHREMIDALNNLQSGTKNAPKLFKAFLTLLVRSLIFGPEPCVRMEGTRLADDCVTIADDDLEGYVGSEIVISQQLSSDGGLLGDIATFRENDVVFIGRCGSSAVYIDKLQKMLSEEELDDLDLPSKEVAVFSIPWAHEQVSNLHGMITCEDGVWRYTDFSTFGTRLVGRGKGDAELDAWFCNSSRELVPGNTLYLGVTEEDEGETHLYFRGAAIRVSYHLDTDRIADIL